MHDLEDPVRVLLEGTNETIRAIVSWESFDCFGHARGVFLSSSRPSNRNRVIILRKYASSFAVISISFRRAGKFSTRLLELYKRCQLQVDGEL